MNRAAGGEYPRAAGPGWGSRRLAAACALAATIAIATALPCLADPEETDSKAATLDPDYATGKQALERKDWREAARRFSQAALRDPNNADLQNYLGYSYRNLRQFDLAFKHYKRALELNPRHRGAHEYIGEAYLIVKDLTNAQEHLAALESICLLPCEELSDLKGKIAAYKTRAR